MIRGVMAWRDRSDATSRAKSGAPASSLPARTVIAVELPRDREGDLRFRAGGAPTGRVTLSISGLPESVTAAWDAEG